MDTFKQHDLARSASNLENITKRMKKFKKIKEPRIISGDSPYAEYLPALFKDYQTKVKDHKELSN